MNDLIFEIGLILNDLPRSERAFAQAVIESPSALEGATLQKLAYDTGTSDATIIRFCKRLGFSGINDFKIAITEAGKTCQNVDGHLFSNLDTTDIMKEVYRSTLYILNDTMAQATDKYDKAVMSLLNAQSINFFGIGEAYITCMLYAAAAGAKAVEKRGPMEGNISFEELKKFVSDNPNLKVEKF